MWKIAFAVLTAIVFGACSTVQQPLPQVQKRYYIVQAGDNLESVAFTFEISTSQLQIANPWLNPAMISPGMRLTIPRDNQAITELSSGLIWPLRKINISSGFGYRGGDLHAGIDLRAPAGSKIYASASGRVTYAGTRRSYGRMIVIDHGAGIETAYAHNMQNLVDVGQKVRQGQVIATVGRSGNATGYHVHFEVRHQGKPVDPADQVSAHL